MLKGPLGVGTGGQKQQRPMSHVESKAPSLRPLQLQPRPPFPLSSLPRTEPSPLLQVQPTQGHTGPHHSPLSRQSPTLSCQQIFIEHPLHARSCTRGQALTAPGPSPCSGRVLLLASQGTCVKGQDRAGHCSRCFSCPDVFHFHNSPVPGVYSVPRLQTRKLTRRSGACLTSPSWGAHCGAGPRAAWL